MAARARPRGGVAHPAAAVHAAARRGRGEAAAAEPFDRALVLAFCLRVGVGVRAAHAVFCVTLGTVSSSHRMFAEALELLTRERVHSWPHRSTQPLTVALHRRRRPKIDNEGEEKQDSDSTPTTKASGQAACESSDSSSDTSSEEN